MLEHVLADVYAGGECDGERQEAEAGEQRSRAEAVFSEISRNVPNKAAAAASIMIRPPPTPRSASRWMLSSGWVLRSSTRTRATSRRVRP